MQLIFRQIIINKYVQFNIFKSKFKTLQLFHYKIFENTSKNNSENLYTTQS